MSQLSERLLQELKRLSDAIKEKGIHESAVTLFQGFKEEVDNYHSIDQQMVALLKDTFGENNLHDKSAYETVAKSLGEGSVIIYFKSAQMFKIYKRDDVEKLLGGELRTIYKNFLSAYEIIPNESRQKIVILGDITLTDKLDSIKSYISSFMAEKGIQIDSKDIVCFVNTEAEMVEIVINNYSVENSADRDEVVRELLKYISEKEKDNKMSRRLGIPANTSVFKGTEMMLVPTNKQMVGTHFVEYSSILVSNTSDCQHIQKNGGNLILQIGNVKNLTINHGSTVNNNNNNLILSDENPDDLEYEDNKVDAFLLYIKNNKPSWYIPETFIDKNVIYNQYTEVHGFIPKITFTKMFRDRLFGKEIRGKYKKGYERPTLVKTFAYDDIILTPENP